MHRSTSNRVRAGGFTIVEFLVVAGILIILLSIFVPYLLSLRESGNRTRCADRLRQLREALNAYAQENQHNFPSVRHDPSVPGFTAYSGADDPDPFALASTVAPNDVTASLWLLVRRGLITDTAVFVCPSTRDYRDRLADGAGRVVEPTMRSNFRSPSNLSYSYASPFSSVPNYRLNSDFINATSALLADQNPGISGPGDDVMAPAHDSDMRLIAKANSNNHGKAGQNVLYGDGKVEFVRTPFSGVDYGLAGRDHIFTSRASEASTQPATPPVYITGYYGTHLTPASPDDSFLVPSDDEPVPPPYLPPTTMPVTQESTQPVSP